MILTNLTSATTQKLQAFCDAAAATTNPVVTVVYRTKTRIQTDANIVPLDDNVFTVLSGVTETDILSAPNTGEEKEILSINVYNADTATRTVSIVIDVNGTNKPLFKPQLSSGRTWRYEKGVGVQII